MYYILFILNIAIFRKRLFISKRWNYYNVSLISSLVFFEIFATNLKLSKDLYSVTGLRDCNLILIKNRFDCRVKFCPRDEIFDFRMRYYVTRNAQ